MSRLTDLLWRGRSWKGKALVIGGALVLLFVLIGALAPAEDSSDESPAAQESSAPPPAPPPPSPPPPPPTPKERVREAVGDEVQASGYAGDLEIQVVSFDGTEAQVTATTPEGGFEGASCGDLDDGAQAVFETIYNDAGWTGGAAIVYQGGLIDSSTGEDLPGANTGIFSMPAAQAKRIDWADEDVLLSIDWSNYRDYCHPALD